MQQEFPNRADNKADINQQEITWHLATQQTPIGRLANSIEHRHCTISCGAPHIYYYRTDCGSYTGNEARRNVVQLFGTHMYNLPRPSFRVQHQRCQLGMRCKCRPAHTGWSRHSAACSSCCRCREDTAREPWVVRPSRVKPRSSVLQASMDTARADCSVVFPGGHLQTNSKNNRKIQVSGLHLQPGLCATTASAISGATVLTERRHDHPPCHQPVIGYVDEPDRSPSRLACKPPAARTQPPPLPNEAG